MIYAEKLIYVAIIGFILHGILIFIRIKIWRLDEKRKQKRNEKIWEIF